MSNSNNDDDDYKVGYGKPPKHTQFQKGRSGNPRGRGRGARTEVMSVPLTFVDTLDKVLRRQASVQMNGRKIKITQAELFIEALVKLAIKGHSTALKILLPYLQNSQAFGQRPPTMSEIAASLTPEERLAIDGIKAELAQYLPPDEMQVTEPEEDEDS